MSSKGHKHVAALISGSLVLSLALAVSASARTAQQITLSPTRTVVSSAVFEVEARSSSGERVTATSLTPSVCAITHTSKEEGASVSIVHALAAGTCTIAARQTGSAAYYAAEAEGSFAVIAATSATNFGIIGGGPEAGSGAINVSAEFGWAGTVHWRFTYIGESGATDVFSEGSLAIADEHKTTVSDKFTAAPSAAAIAEMDRRTRRAEAGLPVREELTLECELEGCPVSHEWATTVSNASEAPAIDREVTLEELDEIALKQARGGTVTAIDAVRSTDEGIRDLLDPSCAGRCGLPKENEVPAFLVVLHGRGFTPAEFSPPAGYSGGEPRGDALVFSIGALPGAGSSESCCSSEPKLASLGSVVKLPTSGALKITFNSSVPRSAMVGGADYDVSATSANGLPVSFSSATPAVCPISGSEVSFREAGICTIHASVVDPETGAVNESRQFFTVGPQIMKVLGNPRVGPSDGRVTLKTSASVTGILRWKLSFEGEPQSGVYGEGSMTVAGGSSPRIEVRPSLAVLRRLRRADRARDGVSIKAVLSFSEAGTEALPVTLERSFTIHFASDGH